MDSELPGPQVRYELFNFKKKIITWDEHENELSNSFDKAAQAYHIGNLLHEFSHLEYGISKWSIPILINVKSVDPLNYNIGRSATTKMDASDKFSLFTELCISVLAENGKLIKYDSKKQLLQLHKMLIRAAELRNIVAHAEWVENFYDTWFVTGYKFNNQSGVYDCILHRLGEDDLRQASEYMDRVNQCVSSTLEYTLY